MVLFYEIYYLWIFFHLKMTAKLKNGHNSPLPHKSSFIQLENGYSSLGSTYEHSLFR